jgi:hypothetical protein
MGRAGRPFMTGRLHEGSLPSACAFRNRRQGWSATNRASTRAESTLTLPLLARIFRL